MPQQRSVRSARSSAPAIRARSSSRFLPSSRRPPRPSSTPRSATSPGSPPPELLVVVGGDTLFRLCRAIGAESSRGDRRVEPRRSGIANRRRRLAWNPAHLEIGRLRRRGHPCPRPRQCRSRRPLMSVQQIGITMGDPAGIGPEIILKALAEIAERKEKSGVAPIVYGTRQAMADAAKALGLAVRFVDPSTRPRWPSVALVECGEPRHPIRLATLDAEAGRLAFAAIERAVRDAMAGEIAAIVTAPDFQGGDQSRRLCLCRAHRHARRPHRQPRHLHAARPRQAPRRARLDPCGARQGAGAGDAGAPDARPRTHARRAPSLRHGQAPHRGRGAQPACRRGRAVRR